MPDVKPSEDIQPLSTFRANVASFIDQVRETERPLVLTQHGRSVAVLLGVDRYEALVDELELLRDVVTAEGELDSREHASQAEAVERLRRLLEK